MLRLRFGFSDTSTIRAFHDYRHIRLLPAVFRDQFDGYGVQPISFRHPLLAALNDAPQIVQIVFGDAVHAAFSFVCTAVHGMEWDIEFHGVVLLSPRFWEKGGFMGIRLRSKARQCKQHKNEHYSTQRKV